MMVSFSLTEDILRTNLTVRTTSMSRGWSNAGTGFLETWSMPQACQHLRGIWSMPLTTCCDFWSTLKWSGSWTRWSL